MEPRTAFQSKTIMTDLVLPSETNPINNLFGGELLARMDRAASIAACILYIGIKDKASKSRQISPMNPFVGPAYYLSA